MAEVANVYTRVAHMGLLPAPRREQAFRNPFVRAYPQVSEVMPRLVAIGGGGLRAFSRCDARDRVRVRRLEYAGLREESTDQRRRRHVEGRVEALLRGCDLGR